MQNHQLKELDCLFGISKLTEMPNITLEEIYPGNQTWLLYDKEKPDWVAKERTYFIVALRDDQQEFLEQGGYGFGVLTIEVYS